MRRVLASILAAACLSSSLPAPAVAQFKARASMVPPASAPVGLAPLSNAVGAGTFTGVAAPATSLTPSLLVPSAVTLSVPAGPAAAAASARVVKGVHALGASAPGSALAEGAARLSAASAPDRPPEDGKKAGDETFSGAKPEDGGESSVAGRSSEHRSGLVPATPQPAKKESLVERWKKMAVNGAGPLIGAAFAWNFLTQAAYGILNPARDALLGVKIPADKLPLVFMASAALTAVVVAIYSRFIKKVGRKKLIGGSLIMLSTTLIAGALISGAVASPRVSFGYHLWGDVFGIMSATLFWTYVNDVFTRDESRRSFSLVVAGAAIGSIVGSLAAKLLSGIGPVPLLMIAAAVFLPVLPLFFFMERRASGRTIVAEAPKTDAAPAPTKGIIRTIFSSPFLIFLTALVALERFVPDVTNLLYKRTMASAFGANQNALTEMYANVNLVSGIVTFAVGCLGAPILRKIGVGGSLMLAAVLNLALFVLYPFFPSVWLIAVFYGLEGVARYSLFRSAKEAAYSSTDHDTIYRVKGWIEMVVYRGARGVAGALLLVVGLKGAPYLGIAAALAWIYVCWRFGREHEKLETSRKPAPDKKD